MLYTLLLRPVFVFMTIIFNWINVILLERIDIIRELDNTIRRTNDSSNCSYQTGAGDGSMVVAVAVVVAVALNSSISSSSTRKSWKKVVEQARTLYRL